MCEVVTIQHSAGSPPTTKCAMCARPCAPPTWLTWISALQQLAFLFSLSWICLFWGRTHTVSTLHFVPGLSCVSNTQCNVTFLPSFLPLHFVSLDSSSFLFPSSLRIQTVQYSPRSSLSHNYLIISNCRCISLIAWSSSSEQVGDDRL